MAMTNLYDIYRKVKQRINRSQWAEEEVAAEEATEAARKILESPTLKNVRVFRRAEKAWLSYSKNRIPMADQFEIAIRSRSFYVAREHLNSLTHGHNPIYGFVYCLCYSNNMSLVKIGAAQNEFTRRVRQIRTRYNIIEPMIGSAIECEFPFEIENALHNKLSHARTISPYKSNSREWFKIEHNEALLLMVKVAEELGSEISNTTTVAFA